MHKALLLLVDKFHSGSLSPHSFSAVPVPPYPVAGATSPSSVDGLGTDEAGGLLGLLVARVPPVGRRRHARRVSDDTDGRGLSTGGGGPSVAQHLLRLRVGEKGSGERETHGGPTDRTSLPFRGVPSTTVVGTLHSDPEGDTREVR